MEEQVVHRSLSETLAAAARSINTERVSVGELVDKVGEHSLLAACMILMVPFLIPVSVPGVSTVFSSVVIFTGAGILGNRRGRLLPRRLMERTVPTPKLIAALNRGSRLFARLDRMSRPRLQGFTAGPGITRFNGAMLLAGGILLIFPLGGVPFSNTLPALSILFIAAGMTHRDGAFVLIGYLWLLVSIAYFVVLAILVLKAGRGLTEYFSILLAG